MSSSLPRVIAGAAGLSALFVAQQNDESTDMYEAAVTSANNYGLYQDQFTLAATQYVTNGVMDQAALSIQQKVMNFMSGPVDQFKINCQNTLRDFMNNWPFLLAGLGGLYTAIGHQGLMGFGRAVFWGQNSPGRFISQTAIGLGRQALSSDALGQCLGGTFRGLSNFIVNTGSTPRGALSLVIALGAAILTLDRFRSVYTGEAGEQHFNNMVQEGLSGNTQYGNPFAG
jgi:hypothetical protein